MPGMDVRVEKARISPRAVTHLDALSLVVEVARATGKSLYEVSYRDVADYLVSHGVPRAKAYFTAVRAVRLARRFAPFLGSTPSLEAIERAMPLLLEASTAMVNALGGGSVSKALRALSTPEGVQTAKRILEAFAAKHSVFKTAAEHPAAAARLLVELQATLRDKMLAHLPKAGKAAAPAAIGLSNIAFAVVEAAFKLVEVPGVTTTLYSLTARMAPAAWTWWWMR